MADAMFSFESNIAGVAAEIEQGLARIFSAVGRANAPATTDLLGGLTSQVTRDVNVAMADMNRLKAAADQLARSGVGLPEGQRTLNAELDARIRQLRDLANSRVRGAANDVGGGINVDEIVRELDRKLEPLRRLKRDLMRDVQATGTPEQQAVYGPRTRPRPTQQPTQQQPAAPQPSAQQTPPARTPQAAAPPSPPSPPRPPAPPAAPEPPGGLKQPLRVAIGVGKEQEEDLKAARQLARDFDDYFAAHGPGGGLRPFDARTWIDERNGRDQREVYAGDRSGGLFRVTDETDPEYRRSVLRRDDERATNELVSAAQKDYAKHLTNAGKSIEDLSTKGRLLDENQISWMGGNTYRDPRGGDVRYSKINPAGEARPVTSPSEIQRLEGVHEQQLAAARRNLAEILRINAGRLALNPDAKGIDDLHAARRKLGGELDKAAAAERARTLKEGQDYPTGVRTAGQRIIDPRFDTTRVYRRDRASGGVTEVPEGTADYRAALNLDQERRTAATTRAQLSEAERDYAKHLVAAGESLEERARKNQSIDDVQISRMGANTYRDARGGDVRYSKINTRGEAKLVTNPDEIRRLDTQSAEQLAAARRALAEILRINIARLEANPDSAGIDELHEARRALMRELRESAAAERLRSREAGEAYPTGVRQAGRYIVDPRFGESRVYGKDLESGGFKEFATGSREHGDALRMDEEKRLSAEVSANNAAMRARRETVRQEERAERELTAMLHESSRKGLTNNFLAGLTNPGFGSTAGFSGNFEGLARSAGQAVKYSALYGGLYGLQAAAAAAAEQFLDAEDSIVELTLAMGHGSEVSAQFQSDLSDIARMGGDNVGAAMDIAASGIRAFRDQAKESGLDVEEMGESFARQSRRISILTKTEWGEASNNMKAIAKGFKIEPSETGFSLVADAIAGAKTAGGGDETEIAKGLAGSAITLSQMGYSLRESATIISALNAQTAESGQLVATRVSRVGSIIGGASGKSYLRELNTTLDRLGQERVDLAAPVSEQIQTLADGWAALPSDVQATAINRLGGTSSPREFQALMESIASISEDAAKNEFFDGSAARELEERLKNVRGTLQYMQGDLTAIVTNLAMSGVAAPFVELIQVLKIAMDHLAVISNYIHEWSSFDILPGGKDLGIGTLLVNIAALAAAFKLLSSIRQAGGIRGVISGQEARFMPGRALARQQLADATGTTAPGAGLLLGPTGVPITAAQRAAVRSAATADNFRETGSYLATRQATTAAASFTGTKADDAVHAAAGKLRTAAEDLDKTVSTMEANARTEGRTLTAQEQKTITTQRLAMAGADAELRRAERVQSRAGAIQDRAASERAAVGRRYGPQIAQADREIERLPKTLPGAQEDPALTAANKKRAAVEQSYAAALERIEARRIAAETQLTNSVNRSRAANVADSLTGGATGRIADARAAARTEGRMAGLAAGGRRLGTELIGGARGVGQALSSSVGIAGGLIIAADMAFQFNAALSDLKRTTNESERVRLEMAGSTADELEKAAQTQMAAAEALEKSQEGFFGSMADWATGGGADEEAEAQRKLSRRYQGQADALRAQEEEAGRFARDTTELMSAVDWTDASTISESMKKLEEEGRTATERGDLLTQAFRNLGASTGDLDGLSDIDRRRVAIRVGNRSDKSIEDELRIQERARKDADKSGDYESGTIADNQVKALKAMDSEAFRTATENATRDFLATGEDLNTTQGADKYRAMLAEAYKNAGITPQQYAVLIDDVIRNAVTEFSGKSEQITNLSQLKDLVAASIAEAPLEAAAASRDAQYEALAHGNVDDSAMVGAATSLNRLVTDRELAQQALDAAIAKGTITEAERTEAERQIAVMDDAIAEGYVGLWQSLAAEAKQLNEVSERRRKKAIGQAPTLAAARAITRQASVEQLAPVLAARDTDGLISWIENTDSVIVEQQRKLVEGRVKTATAALDAAKKSGVLAAIRAAQAGLDQAQGEYDVYLSALSQATPGGGGLNAAQLAATQRAAVAAAKQDSLGAAKAARDLAAQNVALARNGAERAQAQQALAEAKNKVTEEQLATTHAFADINAVDDSSIDTATRALRNARDALSSFRGDRTQKEYAELVRAVLVAEREYAESFAELATINAQLGSDLTNPLQQAEISLDEAKNKAARDRERVKSLPKSVQDQINGRNELAIRNLENQLEATTHSEANNLADLQLRAGEINQQAWLRAQRAELERIQTLLAGMKETDNGYEQLRNEALEQKARIRDALKSMAGQWNLGDIKVPTPYEVRRSLNNTVANPMLGQATNVTTTNNITVNGADFAKVVALLNDYIDSGKRYTTSPRRA